MTGYRLDVATFDTVSAGTYTAPSSLRIAGFAFAETAGAPLFQRCGDTYLLQGRVLLPEYLRGGDRRIVLKQSAADLHFTDQPTQLSSTPAPQPAPAAAACPGSTTAASPVATAAPVPAPVAPPTGSPTPTPARALADVSAGLDFSVTVGKRGIEKAAVTSFKQNNCEGTVIDDNWIVLGPVNLCLKNLRLNQTNAIDDIQTDLSAVITFNALLTKGQRATVDAAFDNQRFRGHAALENVDTRVGSESVGLTALDLTLEPLVRRIRGDIVVTVSQLRGTQFFRNGVGVEETRTTINDPWKARLLAGRPDYGRTAISLVLNFLGDLAGALGFKAAGVLK